MDESSLKTILLTLRNIDLSELLLAKRTVESSRLLFTLPKTFRYFVRTGQSLMASSFPRRDYHHNFAIRFPFMAGRTVSEHLATARYEARTMDFLFPAYSATCSIVLCLVLSEINKQIVLYEAKRCLTVV